MIYIKTICDVDYFVKSIQYLTNDIVRCVAVGSFNDRMNQESKYSICNFIITTLISDLKKYDKYIKIIRF